MSKQRHRLYPSGQHIVTSINKPVKQILWYEADLDNHLAIYYALPIQVEPWATSYFHIEPKINSKIILMTFAWPEALTIMVEPGAFP